MEPDWGQVQSAIRLIAGRWTLPVLVELDGDGCRYQELYDSIERVSHKVLTETLRRAERDGLIIRRLESGSVNTTTLYELTTLGRSLHEPLDDLERWAMTNWNHVEMAREMWDRRSGSD